MEGGSSNPLIRMVRLFTIEKNLGDVPLTIGGLRKFGQPFRQTTIQDYHFLYMFKRFGYYSADELLEHQGKNTLGNHSYFKIFLKIALFFDDLFVNRKRFGLWLAGRYFVTLVK